MILKGDKLKTSLRNKGASAFCNETPAVRFQFDNTKEFYGKNAASPLFSYRIKGDFRLPLVRFFVTLAASVAALFCFMSSFGRKKR